MSDIKPYIPRDPNDLIRAEDWNNIQIKAKKELRQKIEEHNHTGGAEGVKLKGDAFDTASELSVAKLTVKTRDILAEIDRIVERAVPIPPDDNVSVALKGRQLRLLGDEDANHGLVYGGFPGKADPHVDGPALFGNGGGLLGTIYGGERIALTWDTKGVSVNGELNVSGGLSVGGRVMPKEGIALADKQLLLREGDDCAHGLGFQLSFAGQPLEGPVLYGVSSGGLGTTGDRNATNQKLALTWDTKGVSVNGELKVNGTPLLMPKVLTATVSAGSPVTDHVPLDHISDRVYDVPVEFPDGTFSNPPVVLVMICSFDFDSDFNAAKPVEHDWRSFRNHRLEVSVKDKKVTSTGFTVRFHTWANTKVHSVAANWIAIGQ
jgi:hypothetical protein